MLLNSLLFVSLILFLAEWLLSSRLTEQLNKKFSRLFLIVSGTLLSIVFAFNLDSRDWSKYQEKFERVTNRIEPGFELLINLVKSWQGDFTQILYLTGILLFAVLMLIGRTRFGSLAILLYAIYPMVWDLNQIRNLLMFLFVLIAFYLLAHRKSILFYLSILAATSFHYTALFYLPLHFLMRLKRRAFYIWIGALLIAASVATLLTVKLLPVLITLTGSAQLAYYAQYIGQFSLFFFGIQVLHQLIDLYTVWWIDRQVGNSQLAQDKKYTEVYYRAVFYTTLYLPFVAFFDEIHRIRRNIQLVKYLYSAFQFKNLSNPQRVYLLALIFINLALTLIMMTAAGDLELFNFVNQNRFFQIQ